MSIEKTTYYIDQNEEEHHKAFDHYKNFFTDERLGRENHFLSLEEDDHSWYIICHTGTRNLGIHTERFRL